MSEGISLRLIHFDGIAVDATKELEDCAINIYFRSAMLDRVE